MTVYIVTLTTDDRMTLVESVWTTKKLAKAATFYHAHHSKENPEHYKIVEREIDTAKIKY